MRHHLFYLSVNSLCMLLLLAIPRASGQNVVTSSDSLFVWLDAPETDFVFCSDISIFLAVTNRSNASITVPYIDETQLNRLTLIIRDDRGDSLRYNGRSHPLMRGDITIEPGDTIFFPISMTRSYAGWLRRDNCPYGLSVGTYTVSGLCLNKYPLNEVRFNVSACPAKDGNFLAASTDIVRAPTDGETLYKAWRDLYEGYKNSDYGATIGLKLIWQGLIIHAPDSVQLHYALDFIQRYPESVRSEEAFGRVLALVPDDELKALFLSRSELLASKYARSMFRLAAQEAGRLSGYREVMGQ